MGDFFNSKFIQDLQNGKLPPVEVELSSEGIVQLAIAIVIAAIIIILVQRIIASV
jgi:hypothetical protein